MSRKNVVTKKIATAQSLGATFNSEPTVIQWLDNVAYQINVTTSNSTGTFAVQASLDYEPSGSVDPISPGGVTGNWVDLELSGGTPSVAAANDSILIDLNQLPYKAIRLRYTSTIAGTGTCDIYINSRQLGG